MQWILASLLTIAVYTVLMAEDGEGPPRLPGATGSAAVVRLEFLGKGLIPTARVLISNGGSERLRLRRRWTYEVIPQTAITDREQLLRLPDLKDNRQVSVAELKSLPDTRVFLTLAEDLVFRSGSDDRAIAVMPGKAWGHDHPLDLRPANMAPGIVFIRLVLTTAGGPGTAAEAAAVYRSDWERYRVPDVPAVPLIRFDSDSRKLRQLQFERAARDATVVTATAASGDFPWTRVLTLDSSDPLAPTLPRMLLDGKSVHVIPDGTPMRYAITGYVAGSLESDARVIAVSEP